MNRLHSLNPRGWGIVAWVATVIIASTIVATGADGKKTDKPKERTGTELYAINCSRCHAERYPRERTDAQWKTIMLHMRVRAQVAGDDAKKILSYLQENN